jgi:hypothetical protein
MSMNLHHAAALALVGWYLMVAPPDADYLLVTSAPVSKWIILQRFDAAKNCEEERTLKIEQADKSGNDWYVRSLVLRTLSRC